MSRVLVTGGAGYIGSHAVQALGAAGHTVVVLDDLSQGHAEAVPGVPLVRARTHDVDAVRRTLAEHRIDAVMHFAAWLAVGESVTDPSGYYHNNVTGSLSLLDAMAAEGVRHLVFSSTCAVYGEPERTPIDEDHPKAPINAYGETKLSVERALPHYARAYGLRFVALRYFNAAGCDPGGTLGEDHDPEIHIIPRAVDAALGRGALRVFGDDYPTPDGTCLRDYVHVADLADAHLRALASLEQGGESGAYNVGTGTPYSVRQVIDTVEAIVGQKVPWTLGPRREGDPAALFADGARIRARLGWAPQHSSLTDIVTHTWRWRAAHPRGYDGAGAAHGSRPRTGSTAPAR
ncbi:MAG: UDP-glucose 4-epimerase GalE [Vicinamibacterales bacterium]|nr:UDP-glucose 4-epimerase GalE [Vicinamibacterales bacterium]